MNYRLERIQQLNCTLEEAWDFFSSPNNLSEITPPELKFNVISNLEGTEFKEGLIIDYTIQPLLGIKMKWKTRISQVHWHKSFTDHQDKGPYLLWNHLHEFEENENGVLMKDTVDYRLPFGIIGRLTHFLIVKKKLRQIFDFRQQILEIRYSTPAA